MGLTVPLSPVVISYPKLQGNLLPACPADTVALNSYPCQVQFEKKKYLTFVYKLTREATLCAKILNTIPKLTYMSLPYKQPPS